ncbi:glycine N-acyltransferase-like isoform X3 [Halichondria panicea]
MTVNSLSGEVEMTRSSLRTIIHQLEDDTPRALSTIGLLKHAIEGRVLCKIHINGWPSFNTIICEVIYPRASEVADILCYSRGSGEDVLQLILSNNLISWGRRQQIYYLESKFSDYLSENLLDPSTGGRVLKPSKEYVSAYFPKGSQIKEIPCPDGFVLGHLNSRHIPLLAKHWGKFHGWTSSPYYISKLILDFETIALYSVNDLDIPVAWILQNPFGRPSSIYITEEYRGMNLGTLLTVEMFKAVTSQGLIPETFTELGNNFRNITAKLGGIESDYTLKWLLLEH